MTPEGRIIQIGANGSCVLSKEKFNTSYEFIARQIKKAPDAARDILNAEEKKYVASRCGGVTADGATKELHEALLAARLIEPRAAAAAAGAESGAGR